MDLAKCFQAIFALHPKDEVEDCINADDEKLQLASKFVTFAAMPKQW